MANVTLLLLKTNTVEDLLWTRLVVPQYKKLECIVYMSYSIALLTRYIKKVKILMV